MVFYAINAVRLSTVHGRLPARANEKAAPTGQCLSVKPAARSEASFIDSLALATRIARPTGAVGAFRVR